MPEVSNFIIPESDLRPIYKLGDNLERKRQRQEQQDQYSKANQAALGKMLMDYADPKEYLSGSPYDPQITKGFLDILQEGRNLIMNNKGLTSDMLMTALAPKVNQLSQYAQAAKVIKQGIDKRIGEIGENSGYDKAKLGEEARKYAWIGQDGKLKDISSLDPSTDAVAGVVQERPIS